MEINIKGLNLQIDNTIQDICKTSNATSGSTRSVLYIILIVNILAFMAVINTYRYNWPVQRLEYYADEISDLNKRKDIITDKLALKGIDDSLGFYSHRHQIVYRNMVETYQTVKIPILGNAFDVNNLGVIAGITMFILLVISSFTLNREIDNLIIALNAITERYPPYANKEDFKKDIESSFPNSNDSEKDNILISINFTRRRHHYNYLSMNEILNCPPLLFKGEEQKEGKKSNNTSRLEKLAMRMTWLTFIVYLCIVINDLDTIRFGFMISKVNTVISTFFSLVCLFLIYKLCRRCTRQKTKIYNLYRDFQNQEYQYKLVITNRPANPCESENVK